MMTVHGAGAFYRKSAVRLADPLQRAAATRQWAASQQRMNEFAEQLKLCVDTMPGIRILERNRLMNLARRIFGLTRRCNDELLMAQAVRAGACWMQRNCSPERVLAVVVRSLEVQGVRVPEPERQQLFEQMKRNREGIIPDAERQAIAGAKPVEAVRKKRYIDLPEAELNRRVRNYFQRYVDDTNQAEKLTRELLDCLKRGT